MQLFIYKTHIYIHMIKLDKTDQKLLGALEQDARQTTSVLAKKLGTSQQVISYRIGSLETRKIIGGYYTLINITKLGYTSFRTMICLSNLTKQKHQAIIDYLMKHPNVLWIVDCGGRWDILVNIIAKNVNHYAIMLKELRSIFPEQIQNYDVLTTVEVIYFGRDYFFNSTRNSRHIKAFGDEQESIEVDAVDLEILNVLSEKARIPIIFIANKLNLSPNTVINRIKRLKQNNIITGYKPLIHLDITPYKGYKALIKLHNTIEQKENEMISFLHKENEVVGIIRLVGMWDFEIEFEVQSNEELLSLTRNFRDAFKDVIKEFEVIPLFHEYRYNFFPGDLLGKD